jgi:hypothetical protein
MGVLRKTLAAAGALIAGLVAVQLLRILALYSDNATKIVLYYMGCVLSAAVFIWLGRRFRFKTWILVTGLAAMGFLFQFTHSMAVHLSYENDLQFYVTTASRLLNRELAEPALLYHALFPTTVTFPAFLVPFMGLFGEHRLVPIVLNQIAMAGFSCMAFFLLKRAMPVTWALSAGFLVCLHPFTIIYSNTCNAEQIYVTLVFAAAFIAVQAGGVVCFRKRLALYALSAMLCGLADLFRPLGLIMAIAISLYLFLANKDAVGWKKTGLAVAAVALVYVLSGLGNNAFQKHLTGYDPPSNGFGWNLYVGASANGRWNQADADVFNAKLREYGDPSKIQSHFAREAVNRYRDMGAGVLPHMARKVSWWHAGEYMAEVATRQRDGTPFYSVRERGTYFALIALIDLPILLLALASCLFLFLSLYKGKTPDLLPVALYIAGCLPLLMVMEIAPRYTVSFRMLFCVLAVCLVHGAVRRLRNKSGEGYKAA